MLSSPSDWVIDWRENKRNIPNRRYHDAFASLSARPYPVGGYVWMVTRNRFPIEDGDSTELILTRCKEDQFTCDLGTCVSLDHQCDQKDDCEDQSNENNCSLIHFDHERYLIDKQPPVEDVIKI